MPIVIFLSLENNLSESYNEYRQENTKENTS